MKCHLLFIYFKVRFYLLFRCNIWKRSSEPRGAMTCFLRIFRLTFTCEIHVLCALRASLCIDKESLFKRRVIAHFTQLYNLKQRIYSNNAVIFKMIE